MVMARRSRRKLWCLLGAAVSWAACSQTPAPETIRIGHEADVISIDPAEASEAATHSVLSNIYESLATFDRDMRLTPALAVSWRTPDETTWLLALRRGVRFHDGSILSAADVKFTIDRARLSRSSDVKGQLWSVATTAVVDEATVRVTTHKPDPLLLLRLTYILVVPRSWSPQRPAGTGPYRFLRWEPGRQLEVEAFSEYWGGRPSISRARFVPVQHGEPSLRAIRQGQVDVLRDLPESMLDTFRAPSGTRLVTRPSLLTNYLWFNAERRDGKNPFSDHRVRKAVSLAIDRARIVRALGGKPVAADQLVQKNVFGYVTALPPLEADPEQAAKLLREAGYERGFEATLVHSSGTSAGVVVKLLQGMLADVGIRLRLEPMEWPAMVAAWRAAKLPFFLSGWRFENADATSFLRDCLYSRDPARSFGTYNPGYSNPALDRLIDDNELIFTDRKRLEQYDKVMRLVLDEMPLVPLYHRFNIYAVSDRVRWEPRLDGKLLAFEMSFGPP